MVASKPSRFHDKSSRERITQEMKQIVADAGATASRPGVKALLLAAHDALGKPPFWRVRAAWHEGAGCWTGRVIDDFRERKRRWEQEQLAQARGEAADHMARLASLRDALAQVDPDFYGPALDSLEWALGRHRMGHAQRRQVKRTD